jgi:hypothetical protein
MKTMSAREAKNAFGLIINTARAEPVLIEKHRQIAAAHARDAGASKSGWRARR